jgi:hypothetical protein
MADEKVYEGEYYDGSEAEQAVVRQEHIYPTPMGTGMVKARTGYITSVQNLKPREMDKIERRILKEAALLGEEAFYSWGAGKGRVEGGSIDLAMMMIHAYGNATVVPDQVQETPEAWIFMHVFVDHETTVATPRQWRESKLSVVEGTMDKERKNAIRFGRGQSKNIRNVILHSMPKWLVNKAIEHAKQGARDKLERFIKDKGLAAAQLYTVQQLARYGVKEEHILEKMGKAEIKGLDIDDLVKLSADFKSIDSGQVHAATLFPIQESSVKLVDLKDKLKAQVAGQAPPEATIVTSDPEVKSGDGIQVRIGAKPFTWFVNDGVREVLVTYVDGIYTCNCKPRCTDCAHGTAVQRFADHTRVILDR